MKSVNPVAMDRNAASSNALPVTPEYFWSTMTLLCDEPWHV